MSNKPIGVFDSGLGGLTVLTEIKKILPFENIVYFGDTARLPYGPRSKEAVMEYTIQAIRFLKSKNVKSIIIACNTATARALTESKDKFDIPILGVIEAGARTAVGMTKNNIVGIIGTEGTIRSKAYNREIMKLNKNIKIFDKACPLFVPIVEEGWSNTDVAKLIVSEYLRDLKKQGIDCLILGCTHYPILKRVIEEEVGIGIKLVNPAKETALDLKRILIDNHMINDEGLDEVVEEYYVSDIPEKFVSLSTEFLNKEIIGVKKIDIQKY